MNLGNLDAAAILNRVSHAATESTWITKLLLQLGLDPGKFTFEAIWNHLADAALANVNVATMLAVVGAAFYIANMLMRTIVPLRVLGIISDLFFIGYGVLASSVTTLLLYLLLLPINSVRLYQMLKLVEKARVSAQGDLSMDWLKPFMTPRKYRKDDVLFRRGEPANEMFIIVTGHFLVSELGIELPPGTLFGELGFLSPNNRRTQSVECTANGEVLTITYDRLLELYFQNPEFGYYFLRLTSERLLHNMARLEAIVEQHRVKPQADTAAKLEADTAKDTN